MGGHPARERQSVGELVEHLRLLTPPVSGGVPGAQFPLLRTAPKPGKKAFYSSLFVHLKSVADKHCRPSAEAGSGADVCFQFHKAGSEISQSRKNRMLLMWAPGSLPGSSPHLRSFPPSARPAPSHGWSGRRRPGPRKQLRHR